MHRKCLRMQIDYNIYLFIGSIDQDIKEHVKEIWTKIIHNDIRCMIFYIFYDIVIYSQ